MSEWEDIYRDQLHGFGVGPIVQRMPVPGGWVYLIGAQPVFVPAPPPAATPVSDDAVALGMASGNMRQLHENLGRITNDNIRVQTHDLIALVHRLILAEAIIKYRCHTTES